MPTQAAEVLKIQLLTSNYEFDKHVNVSTSQKLSYSNSSVMISASANQNEEHSAVHEYANHSSADLLTVTG